MNGLLDFDDPKTLGLLSMGLGLLGSRGRFGEALGQAGLQGINAMQQATDRRTKKQMQDFQMRQLTREEAAAKKKETDEQAMLEAARASFTPGFVGTPGTQMVNDALPPDLQIGAQAPIPARPSAFDQRAFIDRMRMINPLEAMKLEQSFKKETPFNKVDPKDYTTESVAKFAQTGNYGDLIPARKMEVAEGQVYDPYNVKPGTAFQKRPNMAADLLVPGPDGSLIPNEPLLRAKRDIARAGASNVSVNTAAKPMLTELGKGVGESINSAFTGAQSAAQTLANANQIASALPKAITGPTANVRLQLAQVGQMMGVGGANTAEVLQNTRAVMQGLARQELAAAGQMRGQGQITESERAILRKAEAGQINEMTKPELEAFVSAIRKTANARIASHQRNLDRLSQDPNAQPMVDYMRVEVPQSVPLGGAGSWGIQEVK